MSPEVSFFSTVTIFEASLSKVKITEIYDKIIKIIGLDVRSNSSSRQFNSIDNLKQVVVPSAVVATTGTM